MVHIIRFLGNVLRGRGTVAASALPHPRRDCRAAILLIGCLTSLTTGLLAQQAGFGTELYRRDPWTIRLDASADPASTVVETSGTLTRVSTRAGAIVWRVADRVAGAFTVRATVRLPDTATGGAGLFFGGYDLEGVDRNYAACLVRADGYWSIAHRNGVELHDFRKWAAATTVMKAGGDRAGANLVEWVVGAGKVTCRINGTDMYSFQRPRSIATPGGLRTVDGDVGLRVDAGLTATFERFEVVTDPSSGARR